MNNMHGMSQNRDDYFTVSPIEDYKQPAYPSRAESSSDMLKKLPKRWMKNIAVVTCVGALNLSMAMGCTTMDDLLSNFCDNDSQQATIIVSGEYEEYRGHNKTGENCECAFCLENDDFAIEIQKSWGGSGAGPFYVAYLTEQEALCIVRNQLIMNGFEFNIPESDFTAVYKKSGRDYTVDIALIDDQNKFGIVFPDPNYGDSMHGPSPDDIRKGLTREFKKRHKLSVSFIYNPGIKLDDLAWEDLEIESLDMEDYQEIVPDLKIKLIDQIEIFISELRR